MHAVARTYAGQGARQLFDILDQKKPMSKLSFVR
jgi:hypothetical protein